MLGELGGPAVRCRDWRERKLWHEDKKHVGRANFLGKVRRGRTAGMQQTIVVVGLGRGVTRNKSHDLTFYDAGLLPASEIVP